MTDCAAPRHGDEPREAETAAHLCGPCRIRLRSDLRRLPALHRSLEQLADPKGASGGGHGDGTGLPYHDAAYERRTQIRRDLTWWTSELAERRGWDKPAQDSVAAMAGWTMAQVRWAVFKPWCGDLAGTMADNRAGAMAIIDPMPRAEIPIPPEYNYCPSCQHTGALYATVYQSQHDKRPPMVTCGQCWHEWDTVQWMQLGKTIHAWHREQRSAA